ncbi:aminopeptidase N-like [Contarinia nasturtii]|uniref:aminopeptidase N-like n=1 Tax=Contarinia nasturtii TaxID=265458 RepID=UPI0012D4A5EF|nr:aminopeptidase N-like [Contarinia nasturtii]
MHTFGYFIVGLLIVGCTIRDVSSRSRRPLDPKYQRIYDEKDSEITYRLPNNTKPETYDITITTRIDEGLFDFDGKVAIQIVALESTNSITLHYRQLTITSQSLRKVDDNSMIALDDYKYDKTTELLTFPTKTQLEKDKKYILTIEYKGELRTDRAGFYRASYVDAIGQEIFFATTQFESTDARHAFPCFDEPALKAQFTIHINHGTKYNAISNMPVKSSNDVNGRRITDFETTPLVSTYLIAFVVSKFKYTEITDGSGNATLQRVYTSSNKLSQTSYSLTEGVSILNAIANYLDVPFSLKKMDQVAIPNDHFGAGAMENWGLVTYRDSYLLYDENVHLSFRKFEISTIISHEFGHQWFGNLVSPHWWTYIWLNEGFATFFEYLGTGLVHADWDVFNYFVVNVAQRALRYDAQSTTRAMSTYAESPNGISNLFDRIAYDKSGAVLRMFWHALTENTFKKGLNYYLIENSYKAVEESNLFESLEKAAKEDKTLDSSMNVTYLFGTWSNQKGFPLLKVSRNYDDGTVFLEQEKYDKVEADADPSLWSIPYNFATANNPDFNTTTPYGWLITKNQTLTQSDNEKWSNNEWLLFNRQQTGFYRILYDQQNYDLINKQLNSDDYTKIHEINRAQYIDDLSDFVYNGRLLPKVLYDALSYLEKEKEYAPWAAAQRSISQLAEILDLSEKFNELQEFVKKIVEPFYVSKKLEATDGEGFFEKYSRKIAVNLACRFSSAQCLNETYTKLRDYLDNEIMLEPDVRGLIFANGIRQATLSDVNGLFSLFWRTDSEDVRKEMITSFGNIQDVTIIETLLNDTIADITLKKSDRLAVVQSILGGSKNGLLLTIEFLQTELTNVDTKIGSVKSILASMAGKITTKTLQTKFNALLDLAKEKGLCDDNDIINYQKIVTEKLDWVDNHQKHYEEGLKDGTEPPSPPSSNTVLIVVVGLLIGGIIVVAGICFIRWKRNKQSE